MKKTTSIFWMEVGYRLRRRDTVPLQGSGGWLISRIVPLWLLLTT